MREIPPPQHSATQPIHIEKPLSRLLMCCWFVLLTPGYAWAALSSATPNESGQVEETSQQHPAFCNSLQDELPVPTAPDIVADQLRLTIQRTQDTALQAKLRNAYLRYLGCQADISQEH